MKRFNLFEVMEKIENHIKNGGTLAVGDFEASDTCWCPLTIINGRMKNSDFDEGAISLLEREGYSDDYLWDFVFEFDNVSFSYNICIEGRQDGQAIRQECLRRGYPMFKYGKVVTK